MTIKMRSSRDAGAHPPIGDLEAFARDERAQLTVLARRITGSRDDAEDIVQEVLARLVCADLSSVENLQSYARRAVANECANWGRRRGRRARSDDSLRAEAQRLYSSQPDPNGRAEIASALVSLPPKHRNALVLRYYLDWTDEEIGHTLGCAPATVRSWLARGITRLRAELDEGGRR